MLVAWLWGEEPSPAAPPAPPAMPGPRLTDSTPAPAEPTPAPAPEAKAEAPAPEPSNAPIIDEVTVEKAEVCEGEENLITVKAHTPDGSDAFLHYVVGGVQGQRVPVRSWLPDDGEPPPLEVRVFGKGNVSTVAKVPPFTVKECREKLAALVNLRLQANTWSTFTFEVKLMEPPGGNGGTLASFQPRLYEWNFGDGQKEVTQVPFVTHSYEERKQDSLFSNFLVEVKVRGNAEEPVVGRTSAQLINPAFEDLSAKGVVTLMVQLTPRFPELGEDGVVRQKVRLWHHRDRPVFIHNVVLFRHKMQAGAPVAPEAASAEKLMGASTIGPGRGVEFEAKLDTRQWPDVFSAEYYLEGKDSEGLPVRGAFSIMRPPPKPTKENSHPVVDPLLKAKIVAARKILNQPFVTDEDLWRLEREGKFAELIAQQASAKAAGGTGAGGDSVKQDAPPPTQGPTAAPGEGSGSGGTAPKKPGR